MNVETAREEAAFLTTLDEALKAFERRVGRALRVVVTRLDGTEWRSTVEAREPESEPRAGALASAIIDRLIRDILRWFGRSEHAQFAAHAAADLLNRTLPLLGALREIENREQTKLAEEATPEPARDLTRIDALVRQACDEGTPEEGRRTAAIIACKHLLEMDWAATAAKKRA